jgi:hypothetical protein
MSLPEGSFSRELKEQTSRGLMTDLHIYAPLQPSVFVRERLPSATLSYLAGEYNFYWTTFWHGGEIQLEINQLGGEASIADHDVYGRLGTLNQIGVTYEQYFKYLPPRVGMIDDKPPSEEMIQLFLATAVGNKGLQFEEVKSFMDDFVKRRSLVGRATLGLRKLFLGK